MNRAHAVIMAGGAGTRFWPLSRRTRPKQLLPLGPDHESLLSATVRRIGPHIPPERTWIVTSTSLADAVRADVPAVPAGNVLAEPIGRNTAPCVGWAALRVRRQDPNGIIAVLPADHYIGDSQAFLDLIARSVEAAADGDLVTVGVKPSRPETGYGYIELGEELADGVHRARRFVEKPNRQRAEQFLTSGRFLWNSGMFFFRADAILDAIRTHLPGLGEVLDRFEEAAARNEEQAEVEARYPELPSISIDHGVMEKAQQVLVVPGDFGWSDLGSWTTAWELSPKDEQGNAFRADAIGIDTRGCYVEAPKGKVVALLGVRDLVVVDTEDALLVVPRDQAQEVRRIVDALKARGDEEHH